MISTRCPICEAPIRATSAAEMPHLPFCSARYKRIDLGRWLGEKYSIPDFDASVPPDGDDDAETGLLPPTGP